MDPKITKIGRYRLLREFVGLANNPSNVLQAGDEFTVTQVAEQDSVVFVPEFGGWTFYEIPAEFISDLNNDHSGLMQLPSRKVAEFLVMVFGILVGLTAVALWATRDSGEELHSATSYAFFFVSVGYLISVVLSCRRKP